MDGHCCFAGCDLVTCRRCGAQNCVRASHICQQTREYCPRHVGDTLPCEHCAMDAMGSDDD